jgi:syntaxin 18
MCYVIVMLCVCFQAIKKKAEFRVWILFFLVVCSFSLLFLDWYNG